MAYSIESNIRIITGFSDPAKVSPQSIARAISEADSIINSKIGDVYALPLTSIPKLIQLISEQLAKGILYAEEYGEETQNLDKGWEKTLEYYMGLLDDIQSGSLKLRDDTTGAELTRSNTNLPSFYPNAQSEDDPYDPTYSRITVNKRW